MLFPILVLLSFDFACRGVLVDVQMLAVAKLCVFREILLQLGIRVLIVLILIEKGSDVRLLILQLIIESLRQIVIRNLLQFS